jgi:crotonobetainyl-CoA:carnitine CoA-transferase CaiB-like acyl-CoA transferase
MTVSADTGPPAGPLAGVRVVALEHSVAGPLCSRILGELGADVLKVERPGHGDFSRHWDDHAAGDSAQFWWLNRGKAGATADLRSDAGRRWLAEALGDADVLVYNMSPAAVRRAGLDRDTVATTWPHLVAVQISGYGADGPWTERKAYDMLVQAEAGLMSLTGSPGEPSRIGVSVGDVMTGVYAAVLTLAALHERRATGRGRHVDVAMFDCALELVGPMLGSFVNAGVTFRPDPRHHHAIAPYGVFRCGDGRTVVFAVEQDDEWQRLCREVLRAGELADDERYADNAGRVRHRDELAGQIEACLAQLDAAEVIRRLDGAELAYARANAMDGVASHPVVAQGRALVTSYSEDGRAITSIEGLAARAFGRSLAGAAAPALGAQAEGAVAR